MYLFPCFWIESVFDSIPKHLFHVYVMCHSNFIYVLKIKMAAPDDNLNDDIMVDIINTGTKVDVDDTS